MTLRLRSRRLAAYLVALICLPALLAQQAEPAKPNAAFVQAFEEGRQAMAASKYEQAIKAFKNANKLLHKKCAACYLGMAAAYFHEGNGELALENCDHAIACAEDDRLRAQAHNHKGDILLQLVALDSKKLTEAETEFRTAVQEDANVPVYHLNLGIALLKESRDDEGLREVKAYLALAPQGSYSDFARKLIANPDRARKDYAPDFRLTTLQGQVLSLDQLAGRVVVLDFWATWCHPCVESVPDLKDLSKKYAGQGLVLISVSADEKEEAWREFIEKKKMDWPQYWDSQGQVARMFGVHAFPTYIVIDDKGIIQQRLVGENPQQSVASRLRDALAVLPQLQAAKKPQ